MELFDPEMEIIGYYQQKEKELLRSISRLMIQLNTLQLAKEASEGKPNSDDSGLGSPSPENRNGA